MGLCVWCGCVWVCVCTQAIVSVFVLYVCVPAYVCVCEEWVDYE